MTTPDLGFVAFAVLAQAQPEGASAPTMQGAPTEQQAPAPANQGFKVPGTNGTTGTQAPSNAPPPGGAPSQGPGGLGPMWILIVVMVAFVLMTSLGGRKERKKREAMLAGIKRGDRVQTSGGVIGTVVDLTSTEMTLRVDEVSNTRIRFARGAVQQLVSEGKDTAPSDAQSKPQT